MIALTTGGVPFNRRRSPRSRDTDRSPKRKIEAFDACSVPEYPVRPWASDDFRARAGRRPRTPSTREPPRMCRNIKPLFNFDPPATDDEIDAASTPVRAQDQRFYPPVSIESTGVRGSRRWRIAAVHVACWRSWRPAPRPKAGTLKPPAPRPARFSASASAPSLRSFTPKPTVREDCPC